jgi:hypothetical protein
MRMGDIAAMPGIAEDWMLPPEDQRWRQEYRFGESGLTPPPQRSVEDAYRMGGLAAMDQYREAPGIFGKARDGADAWKAIDVAGAERDVAPNQYLPPHLMTGQETPRVAQAHGALPDEAIDALRWHGLGDAVAGVASAQRAAQFIPNPYARAALMAGGLMGGTMMMGEAQAAGKPPRMGSIFDPAKMKSEGPISPALELDFWRHPDTQNVPNIRRASPETINQAARESAQGMTGPELRALYNELGLTGRPASEFAQTSLGAVHAEGARQAAIDLKLADREVINKLTPEQRAHYRKTQDMPEGIELPSELARPNRDEWNAIKKEVTKSEKEFDTNVREGIAKPTIFDLSPQTLLRQPDVEQFNLPRVAPEMTERLSTVPRGGVQRLERAAANAPLENWGWYNLMQARDLMHSIHGPQKGEQVWQDWVSGVGGTSMVNPIDSNIRSSTWYLQQLLHGNPLPERIKLKDPTGQTVQTLVGPPPAGYGAKAQIQHAVRVREFLENLYDPVTNPKPISYRSNLAGNWMPRTVDTHDIRNMVGMPYGLTMGENAGLLPKEYAYLESIGQRATDRANRPGIGHNQFGPQTQAGQQAATWIGGGSPSAQFPVKGGYTGLKSYPAPFLEALNRRAQVTAQVRGISPEQAMTEAFSGVRPLLGIAGAVGGTALGAGMMGGIADQSSYNNGI